jgi:hypothetical protein
MIRQPGGSLGPSDNWLMPAVGWASPHSAGDTRVGAGTQGLPAQSGHGTVAAVRVRVAMRAGEGRSTSRGLFAEFQHQLLPGISRHSQTANRSAAEVQGSNLKLSRERSRTPSPGGPDAAAKAMRARYPSRGRDGRRSGNADYYRRRAEQHSGGDQDRQPESGQGHEDHVHVGRRRPDRYGVATLAALRRSG